KTSRRIPPTPVAAPWYGSMYEGWLWLSILNATASPPPTSTTPAFSPGPCSTRGPLVGRCLRKRRDDLYEQCSLHIAEKIPSSTRFGSRPSIERMRAYSSGERPCAATTCSVMASMGRRTLADALQIRRRRVHHDQPWQRSKARNGEATRSAKRSAASASSPRSRRR